MATATATATACNASTSSPRASAPALRLDRVVSRGALAYAVAFARDAVISIELETDVQLVLRDGASTRRLRLGPPDFDITDLAVSPDGRTAHVASTDGTVRTIDLASSRPRVTATWHLGDAATAVAVSPDGALLAAGGTSGLFCLRRLADGALLQCVAAHGAAVSGLDFAPAGDRLASSSWDGRVAIWTVPALAVLAELPTEGSANGVAFAPDGARVAIATSAAPPRLTPDGLPAASPARVLLWRPVRGELPRALDGHTGPVTSVAWTHTGRALLTGSWDRTVRLWDVRRHREVGRLTGFAHLVRNVTTGPGARAAAAAWGPGDGPAIALLGIAYPP